MRRNNSYWLSFTIAVSVSMLTLLYDLAWFGASLLPLAFVIGYFQGGKESQ